ncbi:circadian clock protein KaiC [Anaerolineales bacterium HSG24]|nr:circadian clock protein KaiC [Anaerolineales bacterium HSG24]
MTKQTELSTAKAVSIPKIKTGIYGLDEILHGGIAQGRTTLVVGGPGCGKSIMGLEFLYRGAVTGEPSIFVTFEERAESVRSNALTLGWNLAPLEQKEKFFIMAVNLDPEIIISGNFNLTGLLAMMEAKASAMGAKRIVIDAIDVLLRVFDDPARERNELYALHNWLLDQQMTSIITAKTVREEALVTRYEFLDFMVDCVIRLGQHSVDQITTRRLQIVKYRGSGFSRNEYPYVIDEGGLSIIPITATSLNHQAPGPQISSGQIRLDSILAGGYRQGTSILIGGSSGTGKTTIASTFVQAAYQRGEKVIYISFEESQTALVASMLGAGIDLRPAIEADRLHLLTAMPESMGSEEHLLRALRAITSFQADHVIVDAISAARRIGSEQAATEYATRLINKCKEWGVTCFLINQTTGFERRIQSITNLGISSLMDTVIFLRYKDTGGELNRLLLVMKSRGSNHSNQYREFLITDNGINLLDVYVGKGEVLTGVARQEKEAAEAIEDRLREQAIKKKEFEVNQKQIFVIGESARLEAELEADMIELNALRLEDERLIQGRNIRGSMRGEDPNSNRLTANDSDSDSDNQVDDQGGK